MIGMGSHQSAGRAERVWLTPPEIIEILGPFDLDPCFGSPRPWNTAAEHFGPDSGGGMGGLCTPWKGFVWCNPPYDQEAGKWLERCYEHGNALALIFARTETIQFHAQVWNRADAVFFFKGRLTFCNASGVRAKANGGAPSVLVFYGPLAIERVRASGLSGKLIILKEVAA